MSYTQSLVNEYDRLLLVVRQLNAEFTKVSAELAGLNNAATSASINIDSSSNVGIGVTPSGTYKLEILGLLNSNEIYLTSTRPRITQIESDATTGNKRWDTWVQSEGIYYRATDDAATTAGNYFAIQRTGNTIDSVTYSANTHIFTNSSYTEAMRVDSSGNVVINTAALSTTATDGFLYIPTCAGTPTGTPTTYTGRAPIVADSSGTKLWVYIGGAWKSTALA